LAHNYSSVKKDFVLLAMLLFILCLIPESLYAWDMEKNRNGVQVYTRTPNWSKFKEFKGVTTINTSLNSIVALLEDVKDFPAWYYNCKYASYLKRISPVEGITYSITRTPWPTQDRDCIVHYIRTQDPKTKTVMITLEGQWDYIGQKPGLVRIRELKGFWKLTPMKDNKVEVTLQVWLDPGGNIPAWLINAIIVDMPYHSLLNMHKAVLKPRYKNAVGLVDEWHPTDDPLNLKDL